MPDRALTSRVTNPETAWLVSVVPVALTIVALLLLIFILRGNLSQVLIIQDTTRAARRRATLPPGSVPDVALFFTPPTTPIGRFLSVMAAGVVGVLLGLSLLQPMMVALIAAAPLTALLAWALLGIFERRYVTALEHDLTAAVGRLSVLLRSGNGLRQAVEKVLADEPPSPLTGEWSFLIARQGVPLQSTEGIATAAQVVSALAAQTPSRQHATFLDHLSVAAEQPLDVLVLRVTSAYDALQASERRRQEAVTELAQMRYSGMAVGLAGLAMALYLAATQWDRVREAYTGSPLGMIVGVVVVVSLLMPIVGGILLSHADDVDY